MAHPDPSPQRPFLVLTKRRTGGTSLMTLMAQVSAFPSVQHEPFNPERIWGPVVARFRDGADHAALARDIDACLEGTPNIKHCHEIIPEPVTDALLRACVARGYAVFHLTRRDEAARLRSLFLAMATGAWGEEAARAQYRRLESQEASLPPVDLAQVRQRFAQDTAAERRIDALLRAEGIAATPLVFEEIYARDGGMAARAAAIVAHLGVTLAPDDPRLAGFAAATGQNSARALVHLPNHDAFEALLRSLAEGRA